MLNRWLRETKRYRVNLVGRVLFDERIGGQVRTISNPYKVILDNTLLEFNSKTGFKMPEKEGKVLVYKLRLEDTTKRFYSAIPIIWPCKKVPI